MAAVYPAFRQRLGEFLLGTVARPADLTWFIVGVNDVYVYDAAHDSTEAIPENAIAVPPTELSGVKVVSGILAFDDLELLDLVPPIPLDAYIVFMAWEGGSRLVAYLDNSTGGTVPTTIMTSKGWIRWNNAGVLRV